MEMAENDVDRMMLAVSAIGIGWGLHQIRRTAPRLWSGIVFLLVAAFTALMLWFTVDVLHYMLTTPACERNGTCAVSSTRR
jgi:hypothetical protein